MPSTGSLTIKANSFDHGSYDNCTATNTLKFSFTSNVKDTVLVLTCADLSDGVGSTIPLQMWVTDAQNNQEFCWVDFILEDNNDVCQDAFPLAGISGKISYANPIKNLSGVEVNIASIDKEWFAKKITDDSGQYFASSLPASLSYAIKPAKNDSLNLGLSTLDLVLIQRHILGITKFVDPYKIIAADVDDNQRVSVNDLVALRKVILGINGFLPQKRNCYTFIDKSYVFPNPALPFNYPDTILINHLQKPESKENNFIGVKIGDVDFSANFAQNVIADTRTVSSWNLYMENNDDVVNLVSGHDQTITGFQIVLPVEVYNPSSYSLNRAISGNYEIYFSEGKLFLIFHPGTPVHFAKGETLFSFAGKMLNNTDHSAEWKNEFYDETLKAGSIAIVKDNITQNLVNDFKVMVENGRLIVSNLGSKVIQNVSVQLYDVSGRMLVKTWHEEMVLGRNELDIHQPYSKGVYILVLIAGESRQSYKVIM